MCKGLPPYSIWNNSNMKMERLGTELLPLTTTQHLAFASSNIVESLKAMKGTSIQTLDIDDDYYKEVFNRVPNVTENHKDLQDLSILVDGDDEGYLLQIFTKNIIGPIFIEIIQRKNHLSFGEGNFGALFRSIERDQQKRGYLK